jgi:hypothetical protein
MKTKTLIMVCLLIGIGLTRLSGQDGPNGKNGSGSDSYWMTWGIVTDVFCNGQWADYVEGDVSWHMVDFYKNGRLYKIIEEARGVLTSAFSGETFQIKELDKLWNDGEGTTWVCHTYLRGDQGNHYMIDWLYDYTVGYWVVTKFGCPGNEMNNGKND